LAVIRKAVLIMMVVGRGRVHKIRRQRGSYTSKTRKGRQSRDGARPGGC
jgi:hypothetical protein